MEANYCEAWTDGHKRGGVDVKVTAGFRRPTSSTPFMINQKGSDCHTQRRQSKKKSNSKAATTLKECLRGQTHGTKERSPKVGKTKDRVRKANQGGAT